MDLQLKAEFYKETMLRSCLEMPLKNYMEMKMLLNDVHSRILYS